MKRILISGENSYIGNAVESRLEKDKDSYEIQKISLRDSRWKKSDFSRVDVILHVAGIAHVSRNPKYEKLYYKINRDLTLEFAQKAKKEGVAYFIFMSSIIVYGLNGLTDGVIRKDTIPNPDNFYGKSKLEAEEGLKKLESEDFKVAIIRSPMVYGKESKGNYQKLAKAAKFLPVFPFYENKRSMIYIDNLSEFIKILIDQEEKGIFFPQNCSYVSTSEMMKIIGECHGKHIVMVKGFNPLIKIMTKVSIINKIFGNLGYEHSLSTYKRINYQLTDLKESLQLTEGEKK